MRSYLNNAACHGFRPKHVGPARQYSRPRLMKKMMNERGVARFLVAPQGFGKTSLSLEYAESIFSFQGVMWLDCQSPCFLRDLDRGIIASTLSELVADQARLVVFEDVPYLAEERAAAFSADLDTLLSSGWEVVVSISPAFDSYSTLQPDRICIGAHDFLVDDDEMAAQAQDCGENLPACDRVAAFIWGDDEDLDEFLRGMSFEEVPAEMQLAVFSMAVLQSATFEELFAAIGPVKEDTCRFIETHCPYVGIDEANESFCAHELDVARIVRAFGGAIETLARTSPAVTRDALACQLADALMRKGRYDRACRLVSAMASRKQKMAWIGAHHDACLVHGCILPVQQAFDGLDLRIQTCSPKLLIGAAQRLCLLGDVKRASQLAARVMAHDDCTQEQAFSAACICHAFGAQSARAAAEGVLERVAAQRSTGAGASAGVGAGAQRIDFALDACAPYIAASMLRCEEHAAECLSMLLRCEDMLFTSRAGLWQLSVLLARHAPSPSRGHDAWKRKDVEALTALALRCAANREKASLPTDVFEALLAHELQRYGQRVSVSAARAQELAAIMRHLEAQRRRHGAADDVQPASTPVLVRELEPSELIPEMYVRLFGGMEINIGGRLLEPQVFRKQRAKTLLAVLVLNRGHEVPRHDLLRILWPLSEENRALNSFYSLWSELRRAISTPDGQCPYLVRHQASCKLDARYVKSDIDEFDALCRALFFGQPDPHSWLEVFSRLQDAFSCDLLPSETENSYIAAARERCRSRLVDAYVTAAVRLCDVREPQTSLWFARAALETNPGREDAYQALMRAQMLAGQRTLAMETYFSCRDYMSTELGIDPSEQMTRLYASLLDDAPVALA